MKFWWFRIRVSIYGSWMFKRWGLWGFACDDFDRVAFNDDMGVREYFIEAWCRE